MNNSSDIFNEDEWNELCDTVAQDQLAENETELRAATVRQLIWQHIEELEISVSVGADPTHYDSDFEDLLCSVSEMLSDLPGDESEDQHEQRAAAVAREIWDQEVRVLVQIMQSLHDHLYANLTETERNVQKKALMAYVIASSDEQDDTDQWLPLIDAVFQGEPLDLTCSDDLDLLAKAFGEVADLNSRPEVKLCQSLLTALGVPDIDEEAPGEYDFATLEARTYAARDITEITMTYNSAAHTPDRQSKIHSIVRQYGIDQSYLPAILALTESFGEESEIQR